MPLDRTRNELRDAWPPQTESSAMAHETAKRVMFQGFDTPLCIFTTPHQVSSSWRDTRARA